MRPNLISYSHLRWALIPAIAAHNFEEWLTFPRVRRGVGNTLDGLGIGLQSPTWDVTQLALILVTLVPACVVTYSALAKGGRSKDFIVSIVAGIFFANVFIPHIPSALANSGYSPGVVTAGLAIFPVCLLLWRSAVVEGVLSRTQVVGSALIGLLLLLPAIVATMLFADWLLQFQAGLS
jgi:hypothetical protein